MTSVLFKNFSGMTWTVNPRLRIVSAVLHFSLISFLSIQAQEVVQNNKNSLIQPALFDEPEILQLNLSGDTRTLFNDRGDEPNYHRMEISYEANGQKISIPLKVKTRGNFRRQRENCFYPPLLLNFSKNKTPADCLFAGQDKLKLVTPCRGQKYVVQEYLVYKLYNLMTESSFKARLVQVIYSDEKKGKDTEPLFGILLEDEDQMAIRNQAQIIKPNGLRPNKTEQDHFLSMAVFEYMIANTDWSTQYRHNIKLLRKKDVRLPIPVPYDFDHSGIVDAPYAKPAPELLLQSIRRRRYRGYCLEDQEILKPIFARFNELRENFYKVYTECPYLEEKYTRNTLKFLDAFYETINDPKASAKAFGYPCLKEGTGSIVIGGLKVLKK